MKRIKSFLLIAMLSLLGFSSCSDKEEKIDDKDFVISLENFKSFTGKTLSQVQESLNGYGYEYLGFDEDEDASVFEKGDYKLMFSFENDVVFAAGCMASTEKAIAFVDYIDYASKCATYASKGSYDYESFILFLDSYEEFDDYQDHMIAFNENKDDVEFSIQHWVNDNEAFQVWFEAEDVKPLYVIAYININLAPDFKSTKSTLFSPK